MIETKDTTELFERLEREFAEERQLMHDVRHDLAEVERLVPEVSRPSFLRRMMPALIAAISFAVIGFGVGMLVQYQQTQDARDQLAHMEAVATFNAPSPSVQLADEQALWTVKGERVAAADEVALTAVTIPYGGYPGTAVGEGGLYRLTQLMDPSSGRAPGR